MSPARIRTESLLSCSNDGGAVCSCPIFISDSRNTMRRLFEGCGFFEYAPSMWSVGISVESGATDWFVHFNRPAGWRLKRDIKAAIGGAWNWQHPVRFKGTDWMRSGDAGRAVTRAERLWVARWGEAPAPATSKWLTWMNGVWGNKPNLGFSGDGIVCIDASKLESIADSDWNEVYARVIQRLLFDEAVWARLHEATGLHYFQLIGGGWMDLKVSGEVHLRPARPRRNARVTDATLELA